MYTSQLSEYQDHCFLRFHEAFSSQIPTAIHLDDLVSFLIIIQSGIIYLMINLQKESGLEISLTDEFKLSFDNPELEVKHETRHASDMAEVILDQKIGQEKRPLYYIYRDIGYQTDRERFKKESLRYDLTVVLPNPIGKEFNKTKGHYHPPVPENEISYPEVYEVIYGQAFYLIQRQGKSADQIVENYLIEVKPGEKIIIPPDFGHITINPGPDPLVMSNWAERDFSSNYEPIEKLKGGSYYLLKDSPYQLMKNSNYQKVPELKKAKPKELPQFDLIFNEPIYEIGKNNIFKLNFLRHPQKYRLTIEELFKF